MKISFLLFLTICTCTSSLEIVAQTPQQGPLGDYSFMRKPQEIVSLDFDQSWSLPAQMMYSIHHLSGRGDSVLLGPENVRPDSLPYTGHGRNDLVAGNFTGDSRDEVATAWESGTRSVVLAISSIDRFSGEWHDISLSMTDSLTLVNLPYRPDNDYGYEYFGYRLIRVEKGKFLPGTNEQLILAYWEADSIVRIELYDGASGFAHPLAAVSDLKLNTWLPVGPGDGFFRMDRYDIAVSDFDRDGLSEILLFGNVPAASPAQNITAVVYDFDPLTSLFSRKGTADVPHGLIPAANDRLRYIYAVGGRMNRSTRGDGCINIALANSFHESYQFATLPFDVSTDLMSITFGAPQNTGYLTSFHTADINNDGSDEAIGVRRDSLMILTVDSTLAIQRMFTTRAAPFNGSTPSTTYWFAETRRTCVIADIDLDTAGTVWMPELITGVQSWPYLVNPTERFCVHDILLDTLGNVTGLVPRVWLDGYPPYMYVGGNFNGGDIRIGTPKHYAKTDIVQPIVILNAPPTHFDMFNGVMYDINKCYPDRSLFYSKYEKLSESSIEVQTKVSESWSLSESFGVDESYKGIGASFSLKQRYGDNFSRQSGSSTTVTINSDATAQVEDDIFATVVDYDIWEYPVTADDTLIGHILVLDPLQVSNRWFSTKSWNANSYIPDHEVGNILSYRRYPTLTNNGNLEHLISGSYDISYSLDRFSVYNWSLQFSDFAASASETEHTIGMDVSVGFKIFGFSFGGEDNYSRTNVSTHKTTVTENLKLSTHLESVDMGIGEVRYTVTPYSYWARNGALVIDYAVLPELAPPGYTPTWWQSHYDSIPDLTFILPWRLDPEKGYPLAEEAKRYQTHDILFSRDDPETGDTIMIQARIHNYSLAPTDGPVKVSFYIGDPDIGGTVISGLDGETFVMTDTLIRSREEAVVQMSWRIPAGLGQYPRIYAVADPDHEIREIHEVNNKGFSVLGKTQIPPEGVADRRGVPEHFALLQNYPNPFNPVTMIRYSIPRESHVMLAVYNLLGQCVATLVDGAKQAGDYSASWNASGLSSGVYFYRLTAGGAQTGTQQEYTETRKLLLMR